MSQENMDVVRRTLDAYSRRDIETLRSLCVPGLELDWSASRGSLAGIYRGFDEALGFYSEYYETFDRITVEAEGLLEVGDQVVVPNVAYQRGRDGVEVTARSTLVYTLRDLKVTHVRLYQEQDEALKAVGLAQ